jgi:N-methylhydantoinase B
MSVDMHVAPGTDTHSYRLPPGGDAGVQDADPITTQIIRRGLASAAAQMKQALMRTAYTPLIYDILDFAVGIYDPQVRLLGQAPSLPLFLGALNFAIEEAVAGVGGAEALDPGDILVYNWPYGTGAHSQDTVLLRPVFHDGELIAYCAIKAHWIDNGAKEPYCTDTTDVHQEGTFLPGVKLYRNDEPVPDVLRIILANSRMPRELEGDMRAQAIGLRAGEAPILRLIERYGLDTFKSATERIFDHGEAVVRKYIEAIPDGRYVASGVIDDNGVDDDEIPFTIAVEIDGSDVRFDLTDAPDEQRGPMNCPLPTTVCMARVAIALIAGNGEQPNEGHFRPIEVVTRPGTMWHPLPPAPCFLYGWPAIQGVDVIFTALAQAIPDGVPASSGSDSPSLVWWGTREATGEPWGDGAAHPVGQGGSARGDGANSLMHHIEGGSSFTPTEVREAHFPWLLEKVELAQDSGGAGRHRGGLGVDFFFTLLEDAWLTSGVERQKNQPPGADGGLPARANSTIVRHVDGRLEPTGKRTGLFLQKGSTFELRTAGGGGHGSPAERDPEAVLRDVRDGYVSEEQARLDYPHAFADAAQ